MVIPSAGVATTVISIDAACPAEFVAVIVVVPIETAVTRPVSDTVATSVFSDFQVTVLSVASSGVTLAVSCTVCDAFRVMEPSADMEMPSAGVGTTVISIDAVCPAEFVAVIVAEPIETAVTSPVSETVATSAFSDFQVTDLSVASLGVTVAVSCTVCDALRVVGPSAEIVIPSAGVATTVISTEADCPAEFVAVIVAEPTETAVTRPVSDTVATSAFSDFQITFLSVALSGVTVAVSCTVCEAFRVVEPPVEILIPSAGIATTVTILSPVTPVPSPAIALIFADPREIAVTSPVSVTVAISGWSERQDTVCTEVSGSTVALRIVFSPILNDKTAGVTDIDSTSA